MILYNRRGKPYVLLLLVFFLLLVSVPLNKKYYKYALYDIYENFFTYDLGVSSVPNLIGGKINEVDKYGEIVKKAPAILNNYVYGVNDRPPIKRLDINIKFKNFKKIIQDQERALRHEVGSDFTEVKGKLLFDDKKIKAKIRLKGDYPDHWRSLTRLSFRVNIKSNHTVLGYKSFSIQKPYSRQHPYDQTFQELMQRMGNLSSSHNYVHVYFNGEDWGIMNIEEHMSKELLEKQNHKESLILKFSNEDVWRYWKTANKQYDTNYYRLSDPWLNVKAYGAKKYFKTDIYRKWFSYINKEHLKSENSALYDTDSFTKALILALSWGDTHVLAPSNSKFYFNPYELKLFPITLDQIQFKPLDHPLNISSTYTKIVSSSEYRDRLGDNLKVVSSTLKDSQSAIDKYQSYFPVDKKIYNNTLINNFNQLKDGLDRYIEKVGERSVEKPIPMPSQEQANELVKHIYARHFENGEIHIYNLLPDKISILSIEVDGVPINFKKKVVEGFKKSNSYEPVILETELLGIMDNKITINTEYQGGIRKFQIDYTNLVFGLNNPLQKSMTNNGYISKINKDSFKIKKGSWSIKEPIVIDGDLAIESDTELSFCSSCYLIVKGSINAVGKSGSKVVFRPLENSWKGLYILNGQKTSILDHVDIVNTNALSDGLLNLTGGVTFYKSDVKISNTGFYNSVAEDSLNIVHSNFTLDNVTINKSVSDGFDSDFSTGVIKNSKFSNIGGDALDFSGSYTNIENCAFKNVYDKAVSSGESSNVHVEYLNIDNVGVGIASKDGSETTGSNVNISNYKMSALMTYVKKPFYGKPKLDLNNVVVDNKLNAYIRQKETTMSVNKVEVEEKRMNIKKMYKSGVMKK